MVCIMDNNARAELHAAALAISAIAEKNGVSEKEVRDEMQKAMQEGINNPDPEIRAEWDSIPRSGDELTVEEFIVWAKNRIQ